MGDFDSLSRLSIGPASLTLTKYSYRCAPVTGERVEGLGGGPIIGKAIVIEGEGYVRAASVADLMTAVAALKNAMNASGQDVIVYGPGSHAEHSLLAARCIEGGPHLFYEFKGEGSNLLKREVTFRVEAQTLKVPEDSGGSTDEEDDADNYQQTDAIRPDGLRTVVRTAQLRGPNLLSRFTANVLPAFQASFNPLRWVMTQEYKLNGAGDALDYTLTAVELRADLPQSASSSAVDMTLTQHTERDERHRLVDVWDFDILATGDHARMVNSIRQQFQATHAVITRERVSVSDYHELRIRASFSTLRSADGTGSLLDWSQSFRVARATAVYDVKRYAGLDPVLVERPRDVAKLVQSGTAIGSGDFIEAPSPLFSTLLEPPEVEYVFLNAFERATRWVYVMELVGQMTATQARATLKRPSPAPASQGT